MKVVESLEELADAGVMQVKLQGEEEESYPSGARCVYWEWTYGVRRDGQWVVSSSHASKGDLVVITPAGRVDVNPRLLRPHLAPSYERTFDKSSRDKAPELARGMIDEEKEPITITEYCLKAGATYHAVVHLERFHLPPARPDGPPRSRTNAVLVLSDQPFKNGKPVPAVTPAYRHWTY